MPESHSLYSTLAPGAVFDVVKQGLRGPIKCVLQLVLAQ